MYSMVMLVAVASSGDAASFGNRSGCHGGAGCSGTVVVVSHSCHGSSCHGSSCHGGFLGLRGSHSCHGSSCHGTVSASCYGSHSCHGSSCHGSSHSCHGGGFLGLRNRHSCHGGHGCTGSVSYSCHGCTGSLVVPVMSVPVADPCALPATGAPVIMPAAPAKEMPKTEAPKTETPQAPKTEAAPKKKETDA